MIELSQVFVIGGGRWARVFAGVLDTLLPEGVDLTMHSSAHSRELSFWADSGTFRRQVRCIAKWPELDASAGCAVLVVNAARDHADAVRKAIGAGVPVLVEKPIALTLQQVEDLVSFACSRNVRFAPAHVFLFARYLEHFRMQLASFSEAVNVSFRWADPSAETRYGEKKQYDPGVPIYADWLPHVISILGYLFPGTNAQLLHLEFLRGGARLRLTLLLGGLTCDIDMERDGQVRERRIEVRSAKGNEKVLDFSVEPGIIFDGKVWHEADPDWGKALSPVAAMLASFLEWASGGANDSRFDVGLGIMASSVIEESGVMYQAAQHRWLTEHLPCSPDVLDKDTDYLFREILQGAGRLNQPELDRRIGVMLSSYPGCVDDEWLSNAGLNDGEASSDSF